MIISKAQNIYMVGIGGVGMLALALILKKQGKNVWGVDAEKFHSTDVVLDENNIQYKRGFDKKHVTGDIDLVITTAAHGGLINEEVEEARKQNIPVMSYAEALGKVMDMFDTRVSVCGTHGKTTTSGMGAFVADELDIPSGHAVGTLQVSGLDSGGFSGNDMFIAEADEYAVSSGTDHTAKFMSHNPNVIICMNIEHDHVDIYKDLDAVKKTFKKFFQKLPDNGVLIYNRDDENTHEVAMSANVDTISYGFNPDSDVCISGTKGHYTITLQDGKKINMNLSVPGKHNLLNATAILILMTQYGKKAEDVVEALENFKSTRLRFEKVHITDDYTVIVDYGHHPTEVMVTIEAAREEYPDRRIVVFFQPHSFSRTDAFQDEFVQELAKADHGVLLDIYGSTHEYEAFDIRSADMIKKAHKEGLKNVEYIPNEALVSSLKRIVHPGDILIFIGAGDFFAIYGDTIIKELS